jgi:outer membrane lipoprotein carrier protein
MSTKRRTMSGAKRMCAGLVAGLLFAVSGAWAAEKLSLDEVVGKLQARYEEAEDFQAAFTQETHYKLTNTKEQAQGKVFIKRPGKVRWEYAKPLVQEIVVDGEYLWIYQPERKQVARTPLSRAFQGKTPVNFLTGVGRLSEEFKIRFALENRTNQRGNYLLELLPKSGGASVKKILLEVEPKEWTIRSFSLVDQGGNVQTLRFREVKLAQGLADRLFEFKPPAGVAVLTP